MKGPMAVVLFLGFVLQLEFLQLSMAESDEGQFQVQNHLSSTTRYEDSVNFYGGRGELPEPPKGCVPIHLNLVARHGTRSPTKRRIVELNRLGKKLRSEAARLSPPPSAEEIEETETISDVSKKTETVLKEKGGNGRSVIPSWMRGYRSPWEGREMGGELIPSGENELFNLGVRFREKFPTIFDEEYHHSTYPIYATQVPRASASAVGFGLGLFHGSGSLGDGRHRSFSVITDTKAHDTHLYFHNNCQNYRSNKKKSEPFVDRHLASIHSSLVPKLKERFGLNFSTEEIGSIWLLCKQEAAIFGETKKACGLFKNEEIELLEWADDVAIHYLKGYGNSLNYRMGVPLLEDVLGAMDAAKGQVERREREREEREERVRRSGDGKAAKGGSGEGLGEVLEEGKGEKREGFVQKEVGGGEDDEEEVVANMDPFQKARLRFAHAETVIPFSCLLGLFQENIEVEGEKKETILSSVSKLLGLKEKHGDKEKEKKDKDNLTEEEKKEGERAENLSFLEKLNLELALPAPPKPPNSRAWRGSDVAPYAANTALILYHCKEGERGEGGGKEGDDKFRVLVLHNERPVKLPGCGGELFCPYSVFKEKVAGPHLVHNFESTCALEQKSKESSFWRFYNPFSDYFMWFWNLFLFLQKGPTSQSVEL